MKNSVVFQVLIGGVVAGLAIFTASRFIAPHEASREAFPTGASAPPSLAASQPPAAKPPARANPPAVSYPPPNPREMAEQQLRAARAASNRLEAVWAKALPDGQRAGETEQRIAKAADAPGVLGAHDTPTTYDARCRSGLCRIEAQFKPGADPSEWATRLLLETGDQLRASSTVVLPSASGGYQVVIYAFRPGQTPWN